LEEVSTERGSVGST